MKLALSLRRLGFSALGLASLAAWSAPVARAEGPVRQGGPALLAATSGPPRPAGVSPQSRIRAIQRQNHRVPTPQPTGPPRQWDPPLITPEALMAKRAAGDFWLLVDVRITGAYVQDRAAGAVSYPLELLFRDHPPPPPWPKGTQVALYCECPDESSSLTSARLLRELLGSAQGLHVLKGGLEAYMAAGYPVDEGPPTRLVPGASPSPSLAPTPRPSAPPSAAPSLRPSPAPSAAAPSVAPAVPPSLAPSSVPSSTPTPPPAPIPPEPTWTPGWVDD